MRKYIYLPLLVIILVGCSSPTSKNTEIEKPESTTEIPGTARVIGPVILDENDIESTVTAGIDVIIFNLSEPESWIAEINPVGLATFQPGRSDSGMIRNPTLYPVKSGLLTVVLSNNKGKLLEYKIKIEAPAISLVEGDQAAEKSEIFGLSLLGMDELEATKQIESSGRVSRIAERDGESFALTADYSTNRINLTIVSGIVSAISVG